MSFWQQQRHKGNISGTFWIPVLLGVQKPDPLPSISLDTRPDPIQNSSLSWGFNEVSIFASIKILVQSQLVCLKVQLAGNILEQVCGSWWSHCYLDFGNTRHHNHQASTSKVIAGRHLPIGGTQSHPITETRTRPNMLMMHRRFDTKLFCFGWSSVNVVRKLNPGKPWSNKTFF